jgi:hypothetical protein
MSTNLDAAEMVDIWDEPAHRALSSDVAKDYHDSTYHEYF